MKPSELISPEQTHHQMPAFLLTSDIQWQRTQNVKLLNCSERAQLLSGERKSKSSVIQPEHKLKLLRLYGGISFHIITYLFLMHVNTLIAQNYKLASYGWQNYFPLCWKEHYFINWAIVSSAYTLYSKSGDRRCGAPFTKEWKLISRGHCNHKPWSSWVSVTLRVTGDTI